MLAAVASAQQAGAEERLVQVAPAEILRVTTTGSGPPVVLIPSWFASAFAFRNVVPRLSAAGYRSIVIEPLGYGGSARPEQADYSLTAQADRVATVLGTLAVERAVVVAHAGAVSIALRLAYRRPERVAAIVAVEGGPTEAAATSGLRRALRLAPLLKLFGGMKLVRGRVRGALIDGSANPAWVTDAVLDGYMAPLGKDVDPVLDALRGMAHAREPERLEPHLPRIRCPVRLVLGGTAHRGGPSEEQVRLLSTRLPSVVVERVPGAGHHVHEEAPDAVLRAVQATRTGRRLS